MTSRATGWLQRFAPLAAVALLFGALGPFASYIGTATSYQLGRPVWPAICAGALGCVTAILCTRVLSSHGARGALIVSVGLLAAPLVSGPLVPGLAVVGSIGSAVLIPIFLVAIGLSLARRPNAAAGIAALVACGPVAWLLTVRGGGLDSSLIQRLALPHIALLLGTIAIAGTVAAAWLLPWPASTEADKLPASTPQVWIRVGLSLMLAAVSNLDIGLASRVMGALALYLIQAIALPILSALCLLRLRPQHRAGAYLAVAFAGRVLDAALGVIME